MAYTATDICNKALSIIGQKPITSYDDPQTKEGTLCTQLFPMACEDIFSMHPWSCLLKRVQLAADTEAPAFGYAYKYRIPADNLRIYRVSVEGTDHVDYKTEGGYILTDEAAPLFLLYVGNPTSYEILDPQVRILLTYQLAEYLAMPITGKASIYREVRGIVVQRKLETEFLDATQNHPEDPVGEDDFESARL
jgi:hypothetical protein